MLVNGRPGDLISIQDRGLLYGDGVFRTFRIQGGQILYWPRHFQKLQHDCRSLNLQCPAPELLAGEIQQLAPLGDFVGKVIVTRGVGERGYAPSANMSATRIVSVTPPPAHPNQYRTDGVVVGVCSLRLASQPRLAGIKHLNRLENVLAAAECEGMGVAEGLLLDAQGHVIEGIRSNLFMVRDGTLMTPDLSSCGVAGVQRERVMEWAAKHGVPLRIEPFGMDELPRADEVFLVNSVIGLWPVRELEGHCWNRHPIAMQIQKWLDHEVD